MQEEQQEALERRHRDEIETQIRQRLETRASLSRQMEEVAERKRQEARENALYKEEVSIFMEIFAMAIHNRLFSYSY